MLVTKCKMCGGNLNLEEGITVAECEYCGTKQTVPAADDEKKMTLFGRANKLRFSCEFDKAAGVYESIVADFPEEAEAYWGLVLCKYGIEYVDDPVTGKKIPTCHRSSFESLMDDEDFEQVLENADAIARAVYRNEAKQIEELRKGIVEVSSKEEPYDIFICYKETDENGERTIDSLIAQDVYDALIQKGYRVFFSRITLEDKLGQEYEPYIFAALNSAKVMLAFGTDYEYYNAVWVKNEWRRFLHLISKGEKKTLIPCYKGIDAYDIPKEFAKLQAQDMGKVGAVQDLIRGIEKLLKKNNETVNEDTRVDTSLQMATVESLLKRTYMFLEDGEWKSATEYCNRVLDIDPQNSDAYVGLLMSDLRIKQEKGLSFSEKDFSNNKNFTKALKFATSERKEVLQQYQTDTTMHIEKKRSELELKRKLATKASKFISVSDWSIAGLKSDGTVLSTLNKSNGTSLSTLISDVGQCNVSDWRNIETVACSLSYTVGLKQDRTVVVKSEDKNRWRDIYNWREIVAIDCWRSNMIVGLKSDGTIVITGDSNKWLNEQITSWRNIIDVSCGDGHVVGLKSNGFVVAVGKNIDSQCKVSSWNDIVAISCGYSHTVGLKSDGTVVATGLNMDGQCNVSKWRDIVAVSCGTSHTVGLKSDGTVVITGDNIEEQSDVSKWKDIIAVECGGDNTVGLKSDGTVAVTGSFNVYDWKLFDDFENIENEQKEKQEQLRFIEERRIEEEQRLQKQQLQKQQEERRNSNTCQHCGGKFKGIFTKLCTQCGKSKDY